MPESYSYSIWGTQGGRHGPQGVMLAVIDTDIGYTPVSVLCRRLPWLPRRLARLSRSLLVCDRRGCTFASMHPEPGRVHPGRCGLCVDTFFGMFELVSVFARASLTTATKHATDECGGWGVCGEVGIRGTDG